MERTQRKQVSKSMNTIQALEAGDMGFRVIK